MVSNKKKFFISIGAALLTIIILFVIFVKCAGNPVFGDAIGICTFFLVCFSGVCYFLSEDNEKFKFMYCVSLVATIVIPALMFMAAIAHKNNLILF